MSFANWKRKTKTLERVHPGYRAMAEIAAQAAYKAGQRDGLKVAESIAENAIGLRFKLGQKV